MSDLEAVATSVIQQFTEEAGKPSEREHKKKHKSGPGLLVPFDSSCQACRDAQTSNMLRQKYGLAAPVLTDDEKVEITMEDRLGL